jgi:hypothetical protein
MPMKASSLDSTPLAQVQESIRRALAALDEQEQVVAAPAPAGPSDLRDRIQSTRERLFGLQRHARKVADKLNELDGSLASDERDLRAFLGDAAEARQKLAAWAARAVGAP